MAEAIIDNDNLSGGSGDQGSFHRANCRYQQMMQQRWCQGQRKRQILRSQIGFGQATPSRPTPCIGCHHYHGQAYGWSRRDRTRLICGFHPYGWEQPTPCPDWSGPPSDPITLG